MAPTLAQRLEALDQPDGVGEVGAIWTSLRPVLVLGRFLMVILIIVVGELFDDLRLSGFTIGVWALIAGIPLFLLLSMVIAYGDRLMVESEESGR